MACLLDTSILARLANVADPFHGVAANAVLELHRAGEILHVTAQNFVEFRNFATRSQAVNGLGLTVAEAEAKAAVFEATFPILPETPDIYPRWKALVSTLQIVGKRVHDARLVAVCHVHAITHLMTFNLTHFSGMAAPTPGIVVVDPTHVGKSG